MKKVTQKPRITQYFTFAAAISERSANVLSQHLVDATNDPDVDDIYVGFSSNGGDVGAGIAAHHLIKGLPKPVTMHALGAVDSIAVAVFLGARTRYAVPGARFHFHPVSKSLNAGNFNRIGLTDILSIFENDEARLAAMWQSHIELKDGELAGLFQGENAHTCAWALERRIIEAERDFLIPAAAAMGGRIKTIIP